jgi:hypothetical protein
VKEIEEDGLPKGLGAFTGILSKTVLRALPAVIFRDPTVFLEEAALPYAGLAAYEEGPRGASLDLLEECGKKLQFSTAA